MGANPRPYRPVVLVLTPTSRRIRPGPSVVGSRCGDRSVEGYDFIDSRRLRGMAPSLTVFKTVVFSLVVPGTVAGVIPQALVRTDRPRLPLPTPIARIVGSITILVGITIYILTAWRFIDEGRGTPAPSDEPEELVTEGIYRHVRNPMYVGVLLIVLGQGLWYRSLLAVWWAAGCWLGFHNRIVLWEEPHLLEKHGKEYEEYSATVPRWLPRIRSR